MWPEAIHNQILSYAFKDVLTTKQIVILQNASRDVDKDQSMEGSFKHAMRAEGQSKEEAESKMNDFIGDKQDGFIENEGDEALYLLGEALHPIMDSTSPSHEGFQEWEGLDNPAEWIKGADHYLKERKISEEKLKETIKKVLQFYQESLKKKEEKKKEKQKEEDNQSQN